MIVNMYISLMPTILTGIFNMIWCKIPLPPIMKILNASLDCGKTLKDGKRIFGNNKTIKGLLGYIFLGMVSTILWGIICKQSLFLQTHNYFFVNNPNVHAYNAYIGFLLGAAYALFELPNSFLKRRFSIEEGKTTSGIKKYFFIFLDQADSIIGCVLVLCIVYPMSFLFFCAYVLLGAISHVIINMLLYTIRLRKNLV